MEVNNFLGYNISKLRDHQRFFEVMLSRYGSANSITGLYFDGAVSYFAELPKPEDTAFLERIYAYINAIKKKPKPKEQQELSTPSVFLTLSKLIRKVTGNVRDNH